MSKTSVSLTQIVLTRDLRQSLRDPVGLTWESPSIRLDLLIQPSSDYVLDELYVSRFFSLLNELAKDLALNGVTHSGAKSRAR